MVWRIAQAALGEAVGTARLEQRICVCYATVATVREALGQDEF
jgi:hypothetical protein